MESDEISIDDERIERRLKFVDFLEAIVDPVKIANPEIDNNKEAKRYRMEVEMIIELVGVYRDLNKDREAKKWFLERFDDFIGFLPLQMEPVSKRGRYMWPPYVVTRQGCKDTECSKRHCRGDGHGCGRCGHTYGDGKHECELIFAEKPNEWDDEKMGESYEEMKKRLQKDHADRKKEYLERG